MLVVSWTEAIKTSTGKNCVHWILRIM